MGFPLDETCDSNFEEESSAKTEAIGHKVLVARPERCAGCRLCETICSFVKEGKINPSASRVHTVRREWMGLYLPVVCQQCDPPICRSVCTFNAISRDPKTGGILVATRNCTLCMACERACPFGAIRVHPERKSILVCDLCGGAPKCVEWCPQKALQYLNLNLPERRKAIDGVLETLEAVGCKAKVAVLRR